MFCCIKAVGYSLQGDSLTQFKYHNPVPGLKNAEPTPGDWLKAKATAHRNQNNPRNITCKLQRIITMIPMFII